MLGIDFKKSFWFWPLSRNLRIIKLEDFRQYTAIYSVTVVKLRQKRTQAQTFCDNVLRITSVDFESLEEYQNGCMLLLKK